MSYKVGQFIRPRLTNDNYISLIASIDNSNEITLLNPIEQSKGISYCLEIQAKEATEYQNTIVKFSNGKNDSAQISQTVKTIQIPPASTSLKTIVTCKFDGLQKIILENATDIATVKIYKIENLLSSTIGVFDADILTKLEIQGIANQLFCINGEEIRLGRRQNFALSHPNLKITSFGFVPTIQEDENVNLLNDFFTVLYEYQEVAE